RTLLGPEAFRKGTDLYFQRHDGQAVTTDDFVRALEDASGVNLAQFRLWYSQAGTPELRITRFYDPAARTYALTVRQTCPPTPGQSVKKLFHIPLAIGLLDKKGREIPVQLAGEGPGMAGTRVLELKEEEESFLFVNVSEEPVPSILRGFSAPVKVKLDLTDEERLLVMARDSDEFNRWDAGQQLAVKLILALVQDYRAGRPLVLADRFIEAFRQTLTGGMPDKAFQAFALTLPSELYLSDFLAVIDPEAVHAAKRFVQKTLAGALTDAFLDLYEANQDRGPYLPDQESIGRRSMKNTCLAYLMELEDRDMRDLCLRQFREGRNMTDVLAALASLTNSEGGEREEALAAFYEKWQGDALV
ncbi:MAG: DUF3458 domain-containing protein, partial [Dehalococcoidia bacterium]|nr:DUF3458 domain-containing protein [Dehalococcoidia bacterium]